MHGKISLIEHDSLGLFKGLPQKIEVMRYHSLITSMLPKNIVVSSHVLNGDEQEIMALRHKKFPIEGIQFHPESFMTEGGKTMLENFLLQPHNPLNI